MKTKKFLNMFNKKSFMWFKLIIMTAGVYPYQSPILTMSMFTSILFIQLTMLYQLFLLWNKINNFLTGFSVLSVPIILNIITNLLLIIVRLKSRHFRMLFDELTKYWGNLRQGSMDFNAKIMFKHKRHFSKIITLASFLQYVTVSINLLNPLKNKILDIIVPLNASRPTQHIFPITLFNNNTNYNFYMSYLLQLFFVLFIIFIPQGVDSTLALLLNHNSALFDLLRYKLSSLHSKQNHFQHNKNKKIIIRLDKESSDIYHCIRHHQNNIRFFNHINDTFRILWFFKAACIGFIMGMSLYQAVTWKHDLFKLYRYGLNGCRTLFGLFTVIIYGEKIITYSSLQNYIYSSNWYDFSPNLRKIIHLIQGRCNYPCIVSLHGIIFISFEMFANASSHIYRKK